MEIHDIQAPRFGHERLKFRLGQILDYRPLESDRGKLFRTRPTSCGSGLFANILQLAHLVSNLINTIAGRKQGGSQERNDGQTFHVAKIARMIVTSSRFPYHGLHDVAAHSSRSEHQMGSSRKSLRDRPAQPRASEFAKPSPPMVSRNHSSSPSMPSSNYANSVAMPAPSFRFFRWCESCWTERTLFSPAHSGRQPLIIHRLYGLLNRSGLIWHLRQFRLGRAAR